MVTIQFHYGWSATILCIALMACEALIFGTPWNRFFNYSLKGYLFMIITGACNATANLFSGKAMQLERTAFIQAIGYVGIVYGFTFDVTIFLTEFSMAQMLGAITVVFFCVVSVAYKLKDN